MGAGNKYLVFCDKGLKSIAEVLGNADNSGSNRSGVDGAVTICMDSPQLMMRNIVALLLFMCDRQFWRVLQEQGGRSMGLSSVHRSGKGKDSLRTTLHKTQHRVETWSRYYHDRKTRDWLSFYQTKHTTGVK